MHCPDWMTLTAHRHRVDDEEPAGWEEALAHLQECDRCRVRALAADPTLVFQSLAPFEVQADEIARMQEVVTRVRRLHGKWPRRRPTGRFLNAAAAVLVAVIALAYGSQWLRAPGDDSYLPAREAAEDQAAPDSAVKESPVFAVENAPLPLIEGLGNEEARVYQVASSDLDLVVIVDGSLELLDDRLNL